MIIESVGKDARLKLKEIVSGISPDIALKAIPIRGYVEPKNVKVTFNQQDIVVKMRAIKAFKESLAGFREYCFQIGVN